MASEEVQKLWKKPKFTSRILNFIFDEGHCISQWGKFRKEYLHVGSLRYLISDAIPFYVASATLPASVLLDVVNILHLRSGNIEHIIRSNDRPDIHLMVRSLVFPANSFKDLAFLIPTGFKEDDLPLPKFIVFFDNTKEAERATKYLRTLLPDSLRDKIMYFHSMMTQFFRVDELEAMKNSETWGMCATDAFGMVCASYAGLFAIS
jgi:superfamily II DNA helicase RecQ